MKREQWILLALGVLTSSVQAQDASFLPQATQDVGYAEPFQGPSSVGSSEPLFRYDDQERWKHGYLHEMPYYGGYNAYRPYNYHHVFSQAQTAAGWGMPATMPYSQQFWHRYSNMTDLSRGDHSPVAPYVPPPKEFDHYPKPLRPGAAITPNPADALQQAPQKEIPVNYSYPTGTSPQQGVQPLQAAPLNQRPQAPERLVAPF